MVGNTFGDKELDEGIMPQWSINFYAILPSFRRSIYVGRTQSRGMEIFYKSTDARIDILSRKPSTSNTRLSNIIVLHWHTCSLPMQHSVKEWVGKSFISEITLHNMNNTYVSSPSIDVLCDESGESQLFINFVVL